MWNQVVRLQRKIAPEMAEVLSERYDILRHVANAGPVGRRGLAVQMDSSERVVRAQVDFLKQAGLLDLSPLGMTITAEGQELVEELAGYIRELHGLNGLEAELSRKLGLKRVLIIPGDCEADIGVNRELGRAASQMLNHYLQENMTVAVSGGSLMAQVAEAIHFNKPSTTVVPARGGLGERVEYQANTIAAAMANKLGGRYRMLHVPEGVSEEIAGPVWAKNSNILEVIELIKKADILVNGIGQAKEMAARRGFDEVFIAKLEASGAIGEVLGHYFTLEGKAIYITSSLGLHLDDLAGIGLVIAVAGGRRKAEAIVAVTRAGGQDILITDEAAALAIRDII